MVLFFITLLVLGFILFLISFWGRELLLNSGRGERRAVRAILFAVLFVLPLLSIVYLLLFVATIPASMLAFGFGTVAAIYGILHSFYISAQRHKQAFRSKQLSLLKQHIKAKDIERQVAEWNRNYGS
jgi:hypothetical protein